MPKPVTRARTDRLRSLIARLYVAKPRRLVLDEPIISFCFDDFPLSAVDNGARILRSFGHYGTFYLSTSLGGYEDQAGRYADAEVVRQLIADGHDIGSHTHEHIDLLHCGLGELKADFELHRRYFTEHLEDRWPRTFSYPYGLINLRNKGYLARRFELVRGTRAGINHSLIDLAHLRANEISEPETIERALTLIEENARLKGLLIFFTHDVDDKPSKHGSRTEDFEKIVATATASGARILTMDGVADRLSKTAAEQ